MFTKKPLAAKDMTINQLCNVAIYREILQDFEGCLGVGRVDHDDFFNGPYITGPLTEAPRHFVLDDLDDWDMDTIIEKIIDDDGANFEFLHSIDSTISLLWGDFRVYLRVDGWRPTTDRPDDLEGVS